MDAVDVVVVLGVHAVIVLAWLWTAWRARREPPLSQENPPRMDSTLFPWSRDNGGRW